MGFANLFNLKEKTEVKVTGIVGFLEKRGTIFCNGVKVGCPKDFIDERVYLILCKD